MSYSESTTTQAEMNAYKLLASEVIGLAIKDLQCAIKNPSIKNYDVIPFLNTDEFILYSSVIGLDLDAFYEKYLKYRLNEERLERICERIRKTIGLSKNTPRGIRNKEEYIKYLEEIEGVKKDGFKWQKKKTLKNA